MHASSHRLVNAAQVSLLLLIEIKATDRPTVVVGNALITNQGCVEYQPTSPGICMEGKE